MQLTPHFSLDEFTVTNHRNIDNSLSNDLLSNAIMCCEMLERIRAYLSKVKGRDIPINISSGYRCLELNTAVGGSVTSDHMKAFAADWTARQFGTPYEIGTALKNAVYELRIGQLIHEYGRWTHTSVPTPIRMVNRIITISKAGVAIGIRPV